MKKVKKNIITALLSLAFVAVYEWFLYAISKGH